ncbi:MAG: hypothetical protein IKB47_02800 [Clostridia bacterium]|nr:hypothetical protein [Clostridia bacterium]
MFNRAKNSRDPLVFDVFCTIESKFPGSVLFVNEEKMDCFLGGPRELDIITKKCIIEVKSGKKVRKGLRQFEGQKRYAESRGKIHIVYAPKMPQIARNTYGKMGITIVSNYTDLINMMKEHEK